MRANRQATNTLSFASDRHETKPDLGIVTLSVHVKLSISNAMFPLLTYPRL